MLFRRRGRRHYSWQIPLVADSSLQEVHLQPEVCTVDAEEEVVFGLYPQREPHKKGRIERKDHLHVPRDSFGGSVPFHESLDHEQSVEGRPPEVSGLRAHRRIDERPKRVHVLTFLYEINIEGFEAELKGKLGQSS
jgi:hypothetical protein